MSSLLPRLLRRGDSVAIERGRLVIRPASGLPVPEQWLADNRLQLCREVLELVGMDALEYDGYTTGNYGPSKRGGVTLQFVSLVTGAAAYAIFNADLTRARSVAGKKAGSPLPKGQFRVGRRSHFCKFWLAAGLDFPRRLAAIHDYMGRLGEILFTGAMKGERIDAGTLHPISISAAEIAALLPDNCRTNAGQTPDNCRTRTPDKETQQSQQPRGLQLIQTACVSNHGKTVIRECGYTGSAPSAHAQHEDPAVDEWLNDYDSTQGLTTTASATVCERDESLVLAGVPAWDDSDEEEL